MLASRPYCRSEISNQTYTFVTATGKFAVRGIDRSDGRFDSLLYTSVAPVSWNMHRKASVPATRSGPLPEVPLSSKFPATIE
ncbi:hypothetical protein FLT15_01480 [Paenibacillus thiaminolyticus]|uniref:hypothetical protein n=1 Tax=Paenibacillus thiaminolyticus TaxID=49283 RepID=UPI0013F61F91|nr:hypothetical protein [Paenibacillus thiaminolyticus]NGP57089.1 hypothetical protein [Paenibacillus thiaminolyticus]